MIRARLVPILLPALLFPAAGHAADRSIGIGSFDRLRITGPFQVNVATGRSPMATVSGDPRAIDDVEFGTNGSTLTIRMRAGVMGAPARTGTAAPIVITLATPGLADVAVVGGAKVSVGAMRGDRIEVSMAGSGSLAVASADAAQLNATMIGSGSLVLRGGRAARARFVVNGPGGIDAGAVDAGDLVVRIEGLGETKARARYTADVTNTGQGSVSVAGNPKCTVRGVPGGTIACGR